MPIATAAKPRHTAPLQKSWAAFYSSNPVHDAERHHDAQATPQDQQRRQEAALVSDFLQAVRAGQLQAPAYFAPRITDYSRGANQAFKRPPTVAEVMTDALDYPQGPSYDDVLGFVARAANAGNQEAVQLLGRMAATWASHHAGLV